MARPGGKEVGRVNIRAVPDGTPFNRDLKVILERAERNYKITIPVGADVSLADTQLQRFQRNWNGQKITLGAAVATAGAAAALSYASRPRIVPFIVRVSKASLTRAAGLIAALSGLRVTGDLIENVAKKLENLDRALPKAALVTGSVTSIVGLVLSTLGGIVTLGGGLADILGLAAALPGILGGLAVGGTAFALALVDVKKQLGVLSPGFKQLQDQVSNNFWAVARRPIIDFVNATLPELRSGLAITSTAIGGWAATVVQSIQAAFGGGRITAMFAPLIQSIQIAATGALGFAQAIAVLGQVGGSFLPRLAQWVADLSNRFGAYLLQIEASGQLERVIEGGITAAKLLGSSLASIVSILGGIESAAQTAGGGGLATFASVMASIAAAVNSPEFQQALSTLFVGAGAGVAGLAASLAPIGALIASLAPLLSGVFAGVGAVIGEVLGQIATALQSPAFSTGLAVFFEGLIDGIQAVAPALPALATAFGAFLGFAGRLAAVLGPVLGAAFSLLAPIFTDLLTQLQPLLPILGDALISAFTALAPVISQIVTTLLPPLVDLFGQIAPMLTPLVAALMPIIQALLPIITALLPILAPILSLLSPIIELLSSILVPVLQILTPIFQLLGGAIAIVAEIISGVLQTALAGMTQMLTGDVSGATEKLGAIWGDVWNKIAAIFTTVWANMQAVAKGAFNAISGFLSNMINGIIDNINSFLGSLNQVASAISAVTGGAINIRFGKLPHVSLPRLAIGADINPSIGGTAFIGGEGGRKETITDWGRTNRLIQAANALAARALQVGDASSGGSFVINEATDGVEVAMEVARRQNARRA